LEKLTDHKTLCEEYQASIYGEKGINELFTGEAFIIFETENMKDHFLNFWTP
jgi:hypothetical protein